MLYLCIYEQSISILSHRVLHQATRKRYNAITQQSKRALYKFIWERILELNCGLIRIGGTENHLQLLIELRSTVALSDLVKEIKSRSSGWLKGNSYFPNFKGWARDYFAATISGEAKQSVINYINNQEEHHKQIDLDAEFREFCAQMLLEEYEADKMR